MEVLNTDVESRFWRVLADSIIDYDAQYAQQEISAMARKAKDDLSIQVGWMIRSDAQKRRFKDDK